MMMTTMKASTKSAEHSYAFPLLRNKVLYFLVPVKTVIKNYTEISGVKNRLNYIAIYGNSKKNYGR